MLAIAWLSAAGPREGGSRAVAAPANFAAVQDVILSRCSMCHAAEPVWAGIAAPPKGVLLDSAEHIRQHARLIDIWSVRSHAMPPGNITEMTSDERRLLAAWLSNGAAVQ
jgi:uncharacterized membrane protein